MKKYTKEEIEYIKKFYPIKDTKIIAKELGIDWMNLNTKASRLGIKKKLCTKIPWNKGKKQWQTSGEKNYMFGKKHSEETKSKISIATKKSMKLVNLSMDNSPHWKGGKIINCKGHFMIKQRNHPYANCNGYCPEHRLIMEQHLGRYLHPEEVVHHLDHNPKNNDISNLFLFKNSGQHTAYHHYLNRIVRNFIKNETGC